MSEAADSNEIQPRRPALGEVLNVWAVILVVGLLVGAGLSPALKGSRAGLGWWIDRVDLLAGVCGQLAAMATWLLTIQLLLVGFRTREKRALTGALALLGIWPVVALMGAQRTALPAQLWLGAVAMTGASCILVASVNRQVRPALAVVLGFTGISLALEIYFIASAVEFGHAVEVLARVRTVLGLGTALLAVWMQHRQSQRGHLIVPFIAGGCLILFLSAARAGEPDASTWTLVVGRTLRSMTPDAPWALGAWIPLLQVCVALSAVAWTIMDQLRPSGVLGVGPLIAAIVALALAVPITPLSMAALTLLAIAAIPPDGARATVVP